VSTRNRQQQSCGWRESVSTGTDNWRGEEQDACSGHAGVTQRCLGAEEFRAADCLLVHLPLAAYFNKRQ